MNDGVANNGTATQNSSNNGAPTDLIKQMIILWADDQQHKKRKRIFGTINLEYVKRAKKYNQKK
jgi:hypothetical protein